MTFQLRPYQAEGLNALWQYFQKNKTGNPVLAWPTGTGKSLVPAEFISFTLKNYPSEKFLMVTHVKELIKQNYDKMKVIWPDAPIGVYSAGLKSRDIINPIIYGGIQSMYKIPQAFGFRSILFIDEAHLVNPDDATMYQKFIAELKKINPKLRIVGLSATPYRIGQGMITDGGLFTDICHDLTSLEDFNKLVKDGYLAPLIPRSTKTTFDISNVGIQQGEFNLKQLQFEVDKAEITWKAMQELVHYGQNRKSWLIYSTGIEHCHHIADMLAKLGVECAAVHSKMTEEHNQAALAAHKAGQLRAIVSYSKLTTGLDHPEVDLIACLRPTMSVVLWVQMLGRGTRPAEGKSNCLVLDYARNTMRLGPINDPIIPKRKGDKVGEIPIKICEACGVYNHISARVCDNCNHPFEFKIKFVGQASTDVLIKDIEPVIVETFDVNYVIYSQKQKVGKAPYILCTYFSGINAFKEYIFPENSRFPKAYVDWWRQRHTVEPPKTTAEVMAKNSELRPPRRIRVHVNRKVNGRLMPEVLSAEF